MPPAIIAGGIAAAGTIGGALLSSSSQKKAASQANASQQQATQAQLQLGRESMALNRDIYNSNYGTLSPFVGRGNVAGDAINALLGLPSAPAMQSPLAQRNPGSAVAPVGQGAAAPIPTDYNPSGASDPNTGVRSPGGIFGALINSARRQAGAPPIAAGQPITRFSQQQAVPQQPVQQAPQQQQYESSVTAPSAQSALNSFANSAGMQFQLQQGADALNNLYAGRGTLQSGAAMKGINDYAQNTALNNYFMPYMGLLSGQQSIGAGAASSIAGVGQNFGNTAANINAGMGANIQSGADAASNAALLRGQANANMWGSVGGALGGLASSFFPTPRY
jgi:hypothetical protein